MEIYVVKEGDTVDSIAGRYGISASSIIFNNQLTYPYALAIGQALLLSSGAPSIPSYPAYVNGYAYPFIAQNVLEDTLPFLTTLSVFSYGFTTDGSLVPPAVDDSFMIRSALEAGVSPILTLTPFGPDGNFNNYLITTLVNNEEVKANLLDNLLTTLSEKGFQGVDIDFEFILPEDRIPFADFVAETRNFLAPYSYHVSAALAPKTSDDQQGLLYAGKDYGLIGEAADSVLLMTYEWGYTYVHLCHRYLLIDARQFISLVALVQLLCTFPSPIRIKNTSKQSLFSAILQSYVHMYHWPVWPLQGLHNRNIQVLPIYLPTVQKSGHIPWKHICIGGQHTPASAVPWMHTPLNAVSVHGRLSAHPGRNYLVRRLWLLFRHSCADRAVHHH